MSRFAFRWSTPLRLRRAKRDRLRRQLIEAIDDWQQTQQRLREFRRDCEATTERLRRLRATGCLDLTELRQQQGYRALLEGQMVRLEREAGRQHTVVETRRNALVEADREVRVIEKLRDRESAHDQQRRYHTESHQLDDVTCYSWAKQRWL